MSDADFYSDAYGGKPTDYFACERGEMLEFVPEEARRILDVGCAGGGFAAKLKSRREREVWGIEPNPGAAAKARRVLDKVVTGFFEEGADLPGNYFDCIIFNDVLEHLFAPEKALAFARTLLRDEGGFVTASIPNIRHFPTLYHLIVRGDWDYRDSGTLDKTHVKFFTRASILKLFAGAGLEVRGIRGINPYAGLPSASGKLWFLFKVANLAMFKSLDDFKFQQFAVVARARGAELRPSRNQDAPATLQASR